VATIAVYSLKGGVGKTTLAVNLAWCAARNSARRTLLWDLDPQAASTYILTPRKKQGDRAQAIFTKDVAARKLVRHSDVEGLDLIGADRSLRQLDHVFHELDKKKRLAKLLGELDGDYDRLVLDCPPGLTETSEQVMRAADIIIVPVVPSPLSIRAFQEVEEHIAKLGKKGAPLMPVHSMVDRRRTLHRESIERHPEWPVIPMASAIEAMGVHRAPLGSYSPRSAASKAFADLWRAIETRLAGRGK